MIFEQFHLPGLGHASYLLGCEHSGQALVFDPLACRIYHTPTGLAGSPTGEQLRAALDAQPPAEDPTPQPDGKLTRPVATDRVPAHRRDRAARSHLWSAPSGGSGQLDRRPQPPRARCARDSPPGLWADSPHGR